MPIFVSACKHLVVLPGATYSQRLWCILEVFAFVQLVGTRERIVVKPLDDSQNSWQSHLCEFSVRTAQASQESDREKLLAVIESSFGSLSAFDAFMQDLLQREQNDGARSGYREPLLRTTGALPAPQMTAAAPLSAQTYPLEADRTQIRSSSAIDDESPV